MNKLKIQRRTNNELQIAMGERGNRIVDAMLTEMDAARMGAVDREVVRRDLIAMVQEREQMGCPINEELDSDTIEMCNHIVAETGYRSRLEQQHYLVLCIATYFIVYSLLLLVLWGFEGKLFAGMPMNYQMLSLKLVWYYIVYMGVRDRCLIKKKSYPNGMVLVCELILLAAIMVNIAVTDVESFSFPLIIGAAIDITIFFVARHSYCRFLNRQAENYKLA